MRLICSQLTYLYIKRHSCENTSSVGNWITIYSRDKTRDPPATRLIFYPLLSIATWVDYLVNGLHWQKHVSQDIEYMVGSIHLFLLPWKESVTFTSEDKIQDLQWPLPYHERCETLSLTYRNFTPHNSMLRSYFLSKNANF